MRVPACKQRGSGLMELMIAITIGLLLIASLAAMFASTKQAQLNQGGLAQLQDNQRTAMSIIGQIAQSGGYYPTVPGSTATAASTLTADTTNGFSAGQFVNGISGISGAADTLRIRFQTAPGDGILNCVGGSNASTATSNVTYVNVFTVNANSHTLTCDIGDGNGARPLVDQVCNMTVLYGVDGGGIGSVNQYYTAGNLPTGAAIRSLKVTLTMMNPLAGQLCQSGSNAAGQPYQVSFTTLIGLMNQL